MGRPRVLHVVRPVDGGVAALVGLLAPRLNHRGWEVEVAAPPDLMVRPDLESASIPFHPLPMARRPGLSDITAGRALRRLDARRSYSIVHAHASKAGALARAVLPRSRRIVYQPNCLGFAAAFPPVERVLYRCVEQVLVPRTGALLAVCDWERDLAESLAGARSRTRVIPNAVAPLERTEPDAGLRAFAAGEPLAGLVARMSEQKDPLAMVDLAARIEERGVPGRVAIVGNGPLAGEVRSAIESRGLSARARWFPFEGAVGPYLRALDVFVLPSLWEALPLALLEAMTFGLPVVATSVGGVAELVDTHNGYLLAPRDREGLAEAVVLLFDNPEMRERMGRAGSERIARDFDLALVADQISALYAEMMAR